MGNKPKSIFTKGNVEVQNIKVGDIHWEFEYGLCIKSKVISLPEEIRPRYWQWESKKLDTKDNETNEIITYAVTEGMGHYAANLYDHEAYKGCKQI